MQRLKTKILILVASLVVSCGLSLDRSALDPIDPLLLSMDFGIGALNSMAKTISASGSNVVVCSIPTPQDKCNSGSISQTAGFCSDEFIPFGTEQFQYSNLNCTLTAGDALTRTFDFSLQGPYGGSLGIRSLGDTSYTQKLIGGGEIYQIQNSGQMTTNVLGKNYYLNFGNDDEKYFHSVTGTNLVWNLNFDGLGSKNLIDGEIEVFDNMNSISYILRPFNLKWALSSCCHPTSGQIEVLWNDKSALIDILGCESAQIDTYDGQIQRVSFQICD